jgi:uncharacterized RDD family membrane protein YckC
MSWTEHVAPAEPHAAAPAQQYAAVRPGPTTPDGQPLSGWWWRVLAYLIDAVGIGIVANIVSIPSQVGMQRDLNALNRELQRRLDTDPSQAPLGWYFDRLFDVFQDHALTLFLPSLAITLVYHCVLLRWKGATLGKLAVGLRVRRREAPGRLPWGAIAVRVAVQFALVNAAMLIGFAAGSLGLLVALMLVGSLFVLLDCLWPLWDGRRQALHDKVAGTNVVRVR